MMIDWMAWIGCGGIFKTMKRQWTLFSSLDRDWMAWRTVGFSKQ
jgi:hypothetical protein